MRGTHLFVENLVKTTRVARSYLAVGVVVLVHSLQTTETQALFLVVLIFRGFVKHRVGLTGTGLAVREYCGVLCGCCVGVVLGRKDGVR